MVCNLRCTLSVTLQQLSSFCLSSRFAHQTYDWYGKIYKQRKNTYPVLSSLTSQLNDLLVPVVWGLAAPCCCRLLTLHLMELAVHILVLGEWTELLAILRLVSPMEKHIISILYHIGTTYISKPYGYPTCM